MEAIRNSSDHTVYPEILATFLIWRFGGQYQNHQICINLLTICFVLAVQPPNLISANIKVQPDLVQIVKFNDRQYFRIYGILYAVSCAIAKHGSLQFVCMLNSI